MRKLWSRGWPRRFSSQEPHSREQSEDAEDVIAVYMTQADVLDVQKRHFCFPQLYLRPLAAIDHEQAPSYIYYLSAWIPLCRWQCRRRSQYLDCEIHPV